MNELSFFAAFLIGLAGSVHCVGMCGGIVSALSFAIPNQQNPLYYALSYNLGRITSYTIAGAITALLGQLISHDNQMGVVVLQLISGTFLLFMACYIGGWWQGLVLTEKIGMHFWKRIKPFSKRYIPFKHPLNALPYGMIWGWLPCGLVYSTLTWAMASGDYIKGATIMFAFGLGTLPAVVFVGLGVKRIDVLFKHPLFKQLVACAIGIYAVYSIVKALNLTSHI